MWAQCQIWPCRRMRGIINSMNRSEHRIDLLAGLVESLPAGLHTAEDALAGIVEGLLDLRVGRAAPDARNAVTRPLIEHLGDPAQCAGTLEEGIVFEAFERGQGKAGLQDRAFVLAAGEEEHKRGGGPGELALRRGAPAGEA